MADVIDPPEFLIKVVLILKFRFVLFERVSGRRAESAFSAIEGLLNAKTVIKSWPLRRNLQGPGLIRLPASLKLSESDWREKGIYLSNPVDLIDVLIGFVD